MGNVISLHPHGPASILTGLNLVEHVWNMLVLQIAVRQPPPTCLPEFRRALLDEWCNIPEDQIDYLILSIRWRRMDYIALSVRHNMR
ncbi:transposable element Tcb1 transposase [Trichonephila clavipes]|nr:transposable element Tcb1 transposase [Trichonephila clavipes]